MSIFDGFMQGVIQGITEFLPVSSDGHVTLYQHFTGLSGEGALFFTLMLHLGTLLAIFLVYHKTIWDLILEFFSLVGDVFSRRGLNPTKSPRRNMIFMLVATTLPLVFFLPVKDWVTAITEDGDIVMEGLCFLFTSALLYCGARCARGHRPAAEMRPGDAFAIGFFQGFAIMPGISRSGSTIASGLLLGYERASMVEFSFILGIPAVLGGSILELKDALSAGIAVEWAPLLAGMAAATVFGILCIKLIEKLVVGGKLTIFAYYTFALGFLTLAAGIAEHIMGKNLGVLLGWIR